jgi:hypothetical protein
MPIKVYRYNLKEKYDSRKQKPFSKDESEMLYDGKIMKILQALNNKSPQIIELNHEGLLELLQQGSCPENMHNRLMNDFDMPSISTPQIIQMLKKEDFVDNALSSGSHHVKHKKKTRRKKAHKRRKKAHKRHKKATHKRHKKAHKRHKKAHKRHKKATHKRHKKATHKRRRRGKH